MHWPRGGSSISSNELWLHARTVLSLWKVGLQGLGVSLIITPSCRLISLICTAPQIWLTRLELTTSSLELISSCFHAVKRRSFARKWRRREILSCCGQQKEIQECTTSVVYRERGGGLGGEPVLHSVSPASLRGI